MIALAMRWQAALPTTAEAPLKQSMGGSMQGHLVGHAEVLESQLQPRAARECPMLSFFRPKHPALCLSACSCASQLYIANGAALVREWHQYESGMGGGAPGAAARQLLLAAAYVVSQINDKEG